MAKGDVYSDDEVSSFESSGPRIYSDEEVASMEASSAPLAEQKEEPGILSQAGDAALEVVGEVGQFIDRYTGAPTRTYLRSRQQGSGMVDAAKAAAKQFGDDPTLAPTGKDIAQAEGIPDTALSEKLPFLFNDTGEGLALKKGGPADITASGAVGFGLDMFADPTNLVPGKTLASAVSKGSTAVGRGAAKVASALSGVPEQAIKTYAKKMPLVNKSIARYGDDIASAADATRDGYNTAIKSARRKMNAQISESLATSGSKSINIDDVTRSLSESKGALNPALHAAEIAEIDELIKMADGIKGAHGNASLNDFFQFQEILRERAKGAYQKSGQMFVPGTRSQNAAKQASAIARKKINDASPAIAEANNRLALMHNLEDRMNKNLIGSGRSHDSLISVGAGTNKRGEKQLRRLGELTDSDMVSEAQTLAAHKSFAKPELLPTDTTGKSLTRVGTSAVIGYLSGIPGATVALPAAMSPAAIKTGMRLGAPVLKGIQKAGRPGYMGASAVGRQQNNTERQANSFESVSAKLRRNPQAGRFVSVLQKAMERGEESYGSTYFLLMHSEPEFRKTMEGE